MLKGTGSQPQNTCDLKAKVRILDIKPSCLFSMDTKTTVRLCGIYPEGCKARPGLPISSEAEDGEGNTERPWPQEWVGGDLS